MKAAGMMAVRFAFQARNIRTDDGSKRAVPIFANNMPGNCSEGLRGIVLLPDGLLFLPGEREERLCG